MVHLPLSGVTNYGMQTDVSPALREQEIFCINDAIWLRTVRSATPAATAISLESARDETSEYSCLGHCQGKNEASSDADGVLPFVV